MEKNRGNCDSADGASSSGDDKEKANEKIFINHAEIAWHEMRKLWVGDQSKRSRRTPCEPVICFNTTYEDLLLSNTPFHQPIPLAAIIFGCKTCGFGFWPVLSPSTAGFCNLDGTQLFTRLFKQS